MTAEEEILDEKLSSGEYMTYIEIADGLFPRGCFNSVEQQTKAIDSLRQIVSRKLKDKDAIDYKNGKDARDGIKYKKGNEHYLKFIEDVGTLQSKSRIEKKAYATIGLGLLLEDGSTEVNMIELECVRNLTNNSLVKVIATHMLDENVLRFTYVSNKDIEYEVIFHPQYLKEYNNRWAVYGKCEGEDHYPYCIKIDSIKPGSLMVVSKDEHIKYERAQRNYYHDYFKDIIGFSRSEKAKVQKVFIRTNDKLVHRLIKTKPFHESQEELNEWSDQEHFGKFVLHIMPNIELRTKLLAYGAGITIEGNGWFQREIKEEIRKMAELYSDEKRDEKNDHMSR